MVRFAIVIAQSKVHLMDADADGKMRMEKCGKCKIFRSFADWLKTRTLFTITSRLLTKFGRILQLINR